MEHYDYNFKTKEVGEDVDFDDGKIVKCAKFLFYPETGKCESIILILLMKKFRQFIPSVKWYWTILLLGVILQLYYFRLEIKLYGAS